MASVSLISSAAKPVDPLDALTERLLDPKTATALNTLLDHIDLLAILVSGLDSLVSRGDVITESLSSLIAETFSGGATGQSAPTGELTGLLAALRELTRPELIEVLGAVSRAVAVGTQEPASERNKVGGVRGLLRAIKDPDVSRAIGFFLSTAKALGKELDK